ncbi:MAG: hypothetical protein K2F90_06475 [Clostridiales bacterium]|nr:hypothetical protein [Clostridiales bacterium]
MKKRDKILEFLLKPPMWVCIVVWVIGTLTLGGSITLYFVGLGLKLWALSVHLTALVFLILSVYAVLTVIGIPKRAKNNVHVQKFFGSYNVRAFVYAAGSIIFNTCYVVFGIIIANVGQSAWLGVLVGYHIFLIVPRATVFFIKRRDGDKDVQNVRAYAYCGLALMLLALAVIPVIRMVLDDRNTYNYFVSGIIYVTAISTYTFAKLGISLYNLKKVRKSDDLSLKAIKNVSFADALISIFALQAMMLKILPSDSGALSKLNPVLGGLVALGIFAIGLYMLVRGKKMLKALPAESDEQGEKVSEGE